MAMFAMLSQYVGSVEALEIDWKLYSLLLDLKMDYTRETWRVVIRPCIDLALAKENVYFDEERHCLFGILFGFFGVVFGHVLAEGSSQRDIILLKWLVIFDRLASDPSPFFILSFTALFTAMISSFQIADNGKIFLLRGVLVACLGMKFPMSPRMLKDVWVRLTSFLLSFSEELSMMSNLIFSICFWGGFFVRHLWAGRQTMVGILVLMSTALRLGRSTCGGRCCFCKRLFIETGPLFLRERLSKLWRF